MPLVNEGFRMIEPVTLKYFYGRGKKA